MARDYVKKRHSKQRNSVPRQFLLLLTAFLGGYLTATVFDFTSLSAWFNKNILAPSETHPESKAIAKKADLPKAKFEFYTLLSKDSSPQVLPNRPGSNVPRGVPPATANTHSTQQSAANIQQTPPQPQQPISPTNKSSNITAQAVSVVESKAVSTLPVKAARGNYGVQIASFNRRQDAEQLKATLVLRGYDVLISSAVQGHITWFRVILGPYTSRLEAQKTQEIVARNEHMKGMIRQLDA